MLLLLLLTAVSATPQAAYQLFALSPFRLDFSGHQIQEARFQGTKRAAPLQPQFAPKGSQVLLLLPQGHPPALSLSEGLENEEISQLHAKADQLVSERAEKQKAKYNFEGRWEENVDEGSGEPEAVTQVNDSVVEVEGVKGIHDVEEETLTEAQRAATSVPLIQEVETAKISIKPLANEVTEQPKPAKTTKPAQHLVRKSPKLSTLEEIISKKLDSDGRLIAESMDDVIDEIQKDGEEQKVDSLEEEPRKERKTIQKPKFMVPISKKPEEISLKLEDLPKIPMKEKVQSRGDVKKLPAQPVTTKPGPKIEKHPSKPATRRSKPVVSQPKTPVHMVDGGSEEEIAEIVAPISSSTLPILEITMTTPATTTTTTTIPPTTSTSSFFKQIWPTEVVIEGRVFYLVPKNARARDYLEPYRGGGYLLKKSPQDWFRGLHEVLVLVTNKKQGFSATTTTAETSLDYQL